MNRSDDITNTMRTVRFHQYGEPGDVLHLESIAVPNPGPGRIRIAVLACGLTPADWALQHGRVRRRANRTHPRGQGHRHRRANLRRTAEPTRRRSDPLR